jgi:hypothetical protein
LGEIIKVRDNRRDGGPNLEKGKRLKFEVNQKRSVSHHSNEPRGINASKAWPCGPHSTTGNFIAKKPTTTTQLQGARA